MAYKYSSETGKLNAEHIIALCGTLLEWPLIELAARTNCVRLRQRVLKLPQETCDGFHLECMCIFSGDFFCGVLPDASTHFNESSHFLEVYMQSVRYFCIELGRCHLCVTCLCV